MVVWNTHWRNLSAQKLQTLFIHRAIQHQKVPHCMMLAFCNPLLPLLNKDDILEVKLCRLSVLCGCATILDALLAIGFIVL